jgi:molybdopterin-containing oxidoreductase family membrane subunit
LCVDIYEKFMAGDLKGSLKAQFSLAPLRIAFTLGTFPAVIKESLNLLGIEAGPCMEPAGPITSEEREKLRKILERSRNGYCAVGVDSQLPGWHSTIFPPYFVAGAVFSGFAMVQNVLIFVRQAFNLKQIITLDHLEKMNKVMIVTGSMVGYAYAMEFFIAWYSGNQLEQFVFLNRALGPYAWAYWIMVTCNVVFPQLFWIRRFRRSIPVMFAIGITVNIGMWFERFVIVVTSLSRDFLPSSWGHYIPSLYDAGILIGSFGLFFTLILIFVRVLPVVSISEVKAVVDGAQPGHHR